MMLDVFAIYQGRKYSAGSRENGDVLLRSWDPNDLKRGFKVYRRYDGDIIYIKDVPRSEVERFYHEYWYATYQGEVFQIIDRKDGQLHISNYKQSDALCESLGMTRHDRNWYTMWIPEQGIETHVRISEY